MRRDSHYMRLALGLARRGYGRTSPNPMVGAVLVRGGRIIGRGWHRRAGEPHAEIEALENARELGNDTKGATLYVTLEPCCTHGRTPPCTRSIIAAGVRRLVAAGADPNPAHAGRGFKILRRAGIAVTQGVLAEDCARLNEAFNHWIVRGTPFVTVKAAMTLDGKIATPSGDSKWITGKQARMYGMKLRAGADAILVGVKTVLADDPGLTVRNPQAEIRRPKEDRKPKSEMRSAVAAAGREAAEVQGKGLRRIVLDSRAQTPLEARVVSDEWRALTTVVVGKSAPQKRVAALARQVEVLTAPTMDGGIDLRWLLKKLGAEGVTSLLVEGGGEVNASFLLQRLAQRVAFFYAPLVLGGRRARKAVAGEGAASLAETLELMELKWRPLGADWLLTALVT